MNRHAGYRLPTGGRIDRTRTLQFTFNGQAMTGHPGDTLASALLASGVNIISRSLKYHRPRGFYGAGLEDPQSMLAVRDAHGYDPAIRAGQVGLAQGMQIHTVSGTPSVAFDFGAVAQLAGRMLAAGFYYKTFMWPNWRWFEPAIRRTTGFGQPARDADRRLVQHRHATCDVLIVGGGLAGLLTAVSLRNAGLEVLVAEEQPVLGGSLCWESAAIDDVPAHTFARNAATELETAPEVTVLTSTLVTGAYENNFFTLVQTLQDAGGVRGERLWKLHARHVVLATGMIDRPLLFAGNDRPGIMLSSSVRRLMGEFAVAPARRLAIYTNNDSGYLTALQARRAGIEIAAIVDTRPAQAAIHRHAADALDIPCHFESRILGTRGYRRLSRVIVRQSDSKQLHIGCDGLAVSGGWTPLVHLAAHRGGKPEYDRQRSLFVCRDLPPNWHAIGGANGTLEWDATALEAERAANSIAAAHQRSAHPVARRLDAPVFGGVTPVWLPPEGAAEHTWIDLQNDVKLSDIEIAKAENYTSVEHLKRYTTLGMGTDQGRTSNVNGLAAMAELQKRAIDEVGTTTFRPPYSAIRMATIADARQGDLYRPRRYLPADAKHRHLGAVMEDFGWERPDWYRSNGATREAAVAAEMQAVRQHAGIFDGSSLGKIEITGPDAAAFLARCYVSDMKTLRPGRIRYSVMLREDGAIFDDGVVACIGEAHYLASPTSGNAELVASWFERWRQTEWPHLRVAISTVTSNWAVFAIAGPAARRLVERLEPDFHVSEPAFPHMHWREGRIAGVPARVARVSFTGELQFEISVQSRYAIALFEALLATDGALAPRPVGLEAWLRLRLEKGYLHVGSETNGRTNPHDVGMAAIVAKRRDDFIGKRSLSLPFAIAADREQLVGLEAIDGALRSGGRILARGASAAPCPTMGYVTSACYSPARQRHIGLAMLEQGHTRMEEVVSVYDGGRIIRCRVCEPKFYDPSDERLRP